MNKNHETDALSQALAEPSRRALLEHLRFGKKTVTELVQATQLKQPNVSNHLAKMRQQGIVRAERMGRQVYYSIAMPMADILLRLHETTLHPLRGLQSDSEDSPPYTGNGHGLTAAPALHGSALESHSSLTSEQKQPETETLPGEQRSSGAVSLAEWRDAYFHCVMEGREEKATALVNGMLGQRLSLETIYTQVFDPALRRVGELYQQGLTDIAREHMVSAITERMMAKIAQFYTPVTRANRSAVLGCVADNWHELGLRMLSDGLKELGWETLFLGANMPSASFTNIVQATDPHLVVLSCAVEDQFAETRVLVEHLNNLRQTEGRAFQIAVGGHYIQTNPETLHHLQVDFTASDLSHFVEAIHERFPATGKSSAA